MNIHHLYPQPLHPIPYWMNHPAAATIAAAAPANAAFESSRPEGVDVEW